MLKRCVVLDLIRRGAVPARVAGEKGGRVKAFGTQNDQRMIAARNNFERHKMVKQGIILRHVAAVVCP